MAVRKLQQGAIPRGGETAAPDISTILRSIRTLSPSAPAATSTKVQKTTAGLHPVGQKGSTQSRVVGSAAQGAGADKKRNTQPRTARHARGEDAAIDSSSALWSGDTGVGRVAHTSGTGRREPSGASRDVIGAAVRARLKMEGQTAGPQAGDTESQSMSFLRDQGLPLGGGMHEPVMGGGRGEPEGVANAGGNPLAPFMMQMLNPRMSPGSPQGAVPTLQGAPQGFSLYNMLRLIQMFKQLYGQLPVGGQSLPAGVGGAGPFPGGAGF